MGRILSLSGVEASHNFVPTGTPCRRACRGSGRLRCATPVDPVQCCGSSRLRYEEGMPTNEDVPGIGWPRTLQQEVGDSLQRLRKEHGRFLHKLGSR
jgi:hypothetical protein